MKKSYEVTHCEFCDAIIPINSPPIPSAYEQGEIHINSAVILLPKAIVKRNYKPGYIDSHASYLDGYYCSYKCLLSQIKKILYIEKSENPKTH